MLVLVRDERTADAASIHAVTRDAFAGAAHASGTEPRIVGELRRAGALTLSLVAERDALIVGHVAFSPVAVADGSPDWFGLGPISVVPAHQRDGIGTRLIEAGIERLRALGARGCVVLGDPAYYARFGFARIDGLVLLGAPPEYFQALAFEPPPPVGAVTYHAAFDVA